MMTDRDKFKTNIQPHLIDLVDVIEAGDLALELFSKKIITQSSMEKITCIENNEGKVKAAQTLLVHELSRSEGWYDVLLQWLLSRRHNELVNEIDSEYYRQRQSKSSDTAPKYDTFSEVGGCVENEFESTLQSSSFDQSVQDIQCCAAETGSTNAEHSENKSNTATDSLCKMPSKHDTTNLPSCTVAPTIRSSSSNRSHDPGAQMVSPETYPKTYCRDNPVTYRMVSPAPDESETEVLKPEHPMQNVEDYEHDFMAFSSESQRHLYIPQTQAGPVHPVSNESQSTQADTPAEVIPNFTQLLTSPSSSSSASVNHTNGSQQVGRLSDSHHSVINDPVLNSRKPQSMPLSSHHDSANLSRENIHDDPEENMSSLSMASLFLIPLSILLIYSFILHRK